MPMNCLMLFFQTLIIHLHTTTQNEGGGLKQQVILKQTQQFFVLVNLLMVNPLHIVDYIARSANFFLKITKMMIFSMCFH